MPERTSGRRQDRFEIDDRLARLFDDVIEQSRQTIVNLKAILAAAGCTLQHVVKATVYLTDMADYPRVNKVYAEALAPNKPARTCVAVSALPVRERMKIDLVAYREGN